MLFVHEIEICAKDRCIVVGRDLFEKALEIRREMIRRGDLRTRWWIRFMIALFTPVIQGNSASFTFTDTSNVVRNQPVKTNISTYAYILNTNSCNNRFWISVGNGATSPTLDDIKLANKLAEAVATYSYDENNGIITLVAGFTFASDTQITEVGLEWEATVANYNICGRLLVDRTVLSSPFTAPAGTPITVAYRILV